MKLRDFFDIYSGAEIFAIADLYQKQIHPAVVRTFFVSGEIFDFAFKMVNAEMEHNISWGELHVPSDAIRHGQLTLLVLRVGDDKFCLFHLDEDATHPAGSPKTIVSTGCKNERYSKGLGYFVPNDRVYVDAKFPNLSVEGGTAARIIAECAFIMSLINQPRMVKHESPVSRQVRRSLERKKINASNWSCVSWDISKASADDHRKATGDKEGVALHWRRGHWRRAEQHHRGAKQRPDAIRPEERELWWQWIDGMWVGHPAYGFVKSFHAPTMNPANMLARKKG